MNIEDLFKEWSEDSVIDKTELADESIKCSRLHEKYSKLFFKEKMILHKQREDYKILRKEKMDFYADGPSKETEEKGWTYPDKGVIIKAEVPDYLDADNDLITARLRIALQDEKVEYIKSILKSISDRNWNIRNAIEFMKFIAGG